MQPVPTDLILHALAENLLGMEGDDESLRSLGHTILRTCVDLRALPAQWCNGAGVGQQMSWLTRRIVDGDIGPHVAAETRAMEVAISRRLADTAISLLVTQDDGDKTAALTLLEAAHRVVGLPSAEVHAEDTASWQSRVLALEGQLKAAVDTKDAWALEANSRTHLAEKFEAELKGVAVSLLHMHKERDALQVKLTEALADAAAHFEDVKTARDEADALRKKVATLGRDHKALDNVAATAAQRVTELTRENESLRGEVRSTALSFTHSHKEWLTWARNLLGVDDGTAQELQALIGKVVKRAEASSRQNLAHLDAHKAILASLKLDPGASQSDIIETIKSLQADRATLAERGGGDAPVATSTFMVGQRVCVIGQRYYGTITENGVQGLYFVRLDDGSEAWFSNRVMRRLGDTQVVG